MTSQTFQPRGTPRWTLPNCTTPEDECMYRLPRINRHGQPRQKCTYLDSCSGKSTEFTSNKRVPKSMIEDWAKALEDWNR